MFIGHYGPAGASAGGQIKLWQAFIAVQFLDILWAPFVLAGIEHVRIVEGFTASNHIELYDMPYTHSLPMAIVWSGVGGLLFFLASPKSRPKQARQSGAAIIASLVFSHWVLDFITHKPDLELWFGGTKVGLGLWDARAISTGLEFALLASGLGIYLMRTKAKGLAGRLLPFILFGLLGTAQLIGLYGPVPASAESFAISGLVAYFVVATLAFAVDQTRQPQITSTIS